MLLYAFVGIHAYDLLTEARAKFDIP